MTVSHAEVETEIALADVNEIVFDIEAASGENLIADLSDGVTLKVEGKTVTAVSANDSGVTLEAFNSAGIKVASVTGKIASIDMSKKNAGIYILRCSGKTIKFINR